MVPINTRRTIDDAFDQALLAWATPLPDADVTTEAAKLPGARGRPAHKHPVTALAARVTRSSVESGFVEHDSESEERPGGVCLTPSVPAGGVVVAWSVHTGLRLGPGRFGHSVAANEVTDYAPADVLRELGRSVDSFGRASAHIVTLQTTGEPR